MFWWLVLDGWYWMVVIGWLVIGALNDRGVGGVGKGVKRSESIGAGESFV